MHKCLNGWTKKKIIEAVNNATFRYKEPGSVNKQNKVCVISRTKCPIGMFIPKEHKAFEIGGQVDALLNQFPDLLDKMPFDIIGLRKFENFSLCREIRKYPKIGIMAWVRKYCIESDIITHL